MTDSSLTFELSGTIEEGEINPSANLKNYLFIGHPTRDTWYNAVTTVDNGILTGSWDPSVGTVQLNAGPTVNESSTFGDYILLIKSSGDFAVGDQVTGTFEVTGSNRFDVEEAALSEWIVSIGYINLTFPDDDTRVGVSAVPEPSTGLIAFAGLLGLTLRRRR